MRMKALVVGLATSGLLWGCQLDTSSAGSGAGPNVDPTTTTDDATTNDVATTDTPPATGDGTTTGETTSSTSAGPSDTSTGGDDTTEEGSGTEDPNRCKDEPETDVLWAEDGAVADGMSLQFSPTLGRSFAWSGEADAGTLTLEFELECEGPVYLWGLVWDFIPGFAPPNADSYSVIVDGGDNVPWVYGCDTGGGMQDGQWYWLPVGSFDSRPCTLERLELDLEAGPHTIVIANREPGSMANTAAIAGMVFSHDPDADPSQFLEL